MYTGTVGGGISMNAGCFDKEFKDILVSVQVIDKFGKVLTIPSKEIKFEYRKNNIPEDYIFLSALEVLSLIEKKIEATTNKLKSKKEKINLREFKTSGSTFKIQYLKLIKKFGSL